MKKTTICEINGLSHVISELNVGEIDAVVGAINTEGPLHRTYNIMDYDLTPEFVEKSAGINPEFHASLAPEELDYLVSKVEEVNACFLGRVRAKDKKIRAEIRSTINAEGVAETTAASSATTPSC